MWQRLQDEFWTKELTDQFGKLQLMLLTDNLEIADRSLNIAKGCCSRILLFITVFECRNWDVCDNILVLLHRLLEIYDWIEKHEQNVLKKLIEKHEQDNSFHCEQEQTGTRGRPRFVVSKPQIKGLR